MEWRKTLILHFFCITLVITGCEKKVFVGKVLNPLGEGISGVVVQVEGSKFKSTTDKNGIYSLDYIPSKMKIQFSKTGFSRHSIEKDIHKKERYPLPDVTLYPMPKKRGIFRITSLGLEEVQKIKLKRTKRTVRRVRYRSGYRRVYRDKYYQYHLPKKSTFPTFLAERSQLVVFVKGRYRLYRVKMLKGKNTVHYIKIHAVTMQEKRIYNGKVRYKAKRLQGRVKLIALKDLSEGTYVFAKEISTKLQFLYNNVPSLRKYSYIFSVKKAS